MLSFRWIVSWQAFTAFPMKRQSIGVSFEKNSMTFYWITLYNISILRIFNLNEWVQVAMELNITEQTGRFLQLFLLILLPLLALLLGVVLVIENAWYFVLFITWFGTGIVFYALLES